MKANISKTSLSPFYDFSVSVNLYIGLGMVLVYFFFVEPLLNANNQSSYDIWMDLGYISASLPPKNTDPHRCWRRSRFYFIKGKI